MTAMSQTQLPGVDVITDPIGSVIDAVGSAGGLAADAVGWTFEKVIGGFGEAVSSEMQSVMRGVERLVTSTTDQVAVNRAACADYPDVHYVCGDSEAIDEKITERGFDLCFTSPQGVTR